ncbi:hypothetical protein WMY93_007513 [Mugilogobius chulae]|uniref:Alkylated DNA repair protein AlkB homologue 8 N-terminal domain-containing protein n=1 Tax=Mugilogobius chulae TaxID=88201 RepID=A0AAW0PD78_9GOBI
MVRSGRAAVEGRKRAWLNCCCSCIEPALLLHSLILQQRWPYLQRLLAFPVKLRFATSTLLRLEHKVSIIFTDSDFRVNIQGRDIERVDSYKYLGVHLNNKLDWTHNTDALYRKGQSRLYLLRRLRSFGVRGPLLRTFYDSVVASAILYGVVCWSSSITERERKKLDKVIKKSSSVLGCPLDSVREVGDRRVLARFTSMLDHESHPLQDALSALESSFSDRLIHPRCVKERFRRSFLPAAVRLYNEHC